MITPSKLLRYVKRYVRGLVQANGLLTWWSDPEDYDQTNGTRLAGIDFYQIRWRAFARAVNHPESFI